MTGSAGQAPDTTDQWTSVWLRVVGLHPLIFIGPGVLVDFIVAQQPGSDITDLNKYSWLIPIGALACIAANVIMALGRQLTPRERWTIVWVGFVVTVIAFVIAEYLDLYAAGIACHGTYECPI